jgi:hypothetical protein
MFDTMRRADIYEIQGESIQEKATIYDKSETALPQKSAEDVR